jgi:hypothetical protein
VIDLVILPNFSESSQGSFESVIVYGDNRQRRTFCEIIRPVEPRQPFGSTGIRCATDVGPDYSAAREERAKVRTTKAIGIIRMAAPAMDSCINVSNPAGRSVMEL